MIEESRRAAHNQVTLRPVTEEDQPLLYKAYASTRAAEMALVPWNEEQREAFLKMQLAAQQLHYRTYYPEATHDIILLGAEAIGRLYVARKEDEIRILDITILPEHRSRSVGTLLIRALMAEAARAGKSLSIYVESYNPSHRLFERLGFSVIKDDGINRLMEWRAAAEGSSDNQPRERLIDD